VLNQEVLVCVWIEGGREAGCVCPSDPTSALQYCRVLNHIASLSLTGTPFTVASPAPSPSLPPPSSPQNGKEKEEAALEAGNKGRPGVTATQH
jgi:hypothetical protein